MSTVRRSAVGGGMAAALSVSAIATSVRPMPMAEVAQHSGHICWASIESVTPRWAAGHHEIESVVRLVDVEYLKGDGPESIDWVIPGGTLDGFTMTIEGAPEFKVSSRWMLFLLAQWRTHPCVGIWQGAFEEVAMPQGRVVVGSGGVVTGLGANGHARFGSATDRGVTAAQWNALIAPMCGGKTGAAAVAAGRSAVTIGQRVWTSHTARPMRDRDGRPLNAPARQADPSVRRPDAAPVPAMPRPRSAAKGTVR